MRAARWLTLLALFAGGCYVSHEPLPESPLWRDPPPSSIPTPVMEHCLTNAEGTTCQCYDPFERMKPIRCFDEV